MPMKIVFADIFYWVSLANSKDSWHSQVKAIAKKLEPVRIITTEEVLIEVLNFFSGYNAIMRKKISQLVRNIMNNANIIVMPQSNDTFLAGLDLYERRLDKGYSLTDCISMETMKKYNITDVLTNDKHFFQEGFNILLKT